MPVIRLILARRFAGWLLAALLGGASAAAEPPEVVVGILAPQGDAQASAAWSGLADVLQRAVPERRFTLTHFDLPGLQAAVAAARVQFFVANSGFYVHMEAAHGARRIATLQSPRARSPSEAIASAVLVRSERSELQRWSDLKGAA